MQKLLPVVSSDGEIRDRFNDSIRDDREDLSVIDGVLTKFNGNIPQPRETMKHDYRVKKTSIALQ